MSLIKKNKYIEIENYVKQINKDFSDSKVKTGNVGEKCGVVVLVPENQTIEHFKDVKIYYKNGTSTIRKFSVEDFKTYKEIWRRIMGVK